MTRSIEELIDRQLRRWEMERRLLREEKGEEAARGVLKPTIAISRQYGSRAEELGRLLCERLGYELYDRNILEAISANAAFRKATLESLDEKTLSELQLWVESLLRGRYLGQSDYRRHLTDVLLVIGQHGGAVILGRGAGFVLRRETTLHLRVVAPLEDRVRWVVEAEGLSEAEARQKIEEVDEERAAFVRRHFGADVAETTGYDAVLNTGAYPPGELVEVAVALLEAKARRSGLRV
jgi:cytidylate kinase